MLLSMFMAEWMDISRSHVPGMKEKVVGPTSRIHQGICQLRICFSELTLPAPIGLRSHWSEVLFEHERYLLERDPGFTRERRSGNGLGLSSTSSVGQEELVGQLRLIEFTP